MRQSHGARPVHLQARRSHPRTKAAEAAGVRVKIEIEDGKMTVIMDKTAPVDNERNEWDAEYGPDQPEVRKRLR